MREGVGMRETLLLRLPASAFGTFLRTPGKEKLKEIQK
jgi:hypothetical protein